MNAGMILVDKPEGWTSRRVVDHLVKCLGTGKVGHAGTLDPFARGLLCVLWGKGTRLIPYLQAYSKTYRFEVEFGRTTDTQDRTGTTVATSDASSLDASRIEAALPRFRGDIEQMPPMFSALRVEGKRLYEHAREGVSVDRPPRRRRVHALELTGYSHPYGFFNATVSSGTYIRTLAHDLGAELGVGATVVRLERTAVGPHGLTGAATPEGLTDRAQALEAALPLGAVLPDWRWVRVEEPEEIRQVVTGSWRDPEARLKEEGAYRVLDAEDRLLALVRRESGPPQFLGVFSPAEGFR